MNTDINALRDALAELLVEVREYAAEDLGYMDLLSCQCHQFLRDHGDALLARLTSDGDETVWRARISAVNAVEATVTLSDLIISHAHVGTRVKVVSAAPAQPSEVEPR